MKRSKDDTPKFSPWMTPEREQAMQQAVPKDEVEETYRIWADQPDKVNTGKLLKNLETTISSAMTSYAPGAEKELSVPAKLMALNAVKSFDPKMGVKLNTHVFNNMKSLNRLKADRSNVVHIPENVLLEKNKLHQASTGLTSDLGREPTVQELADRTGISPARIAKINMYKNVRPESSMLTEKGDTLFENKKDPHRIWADYVYHDLGPVDKKIYEWSTGYGGNETFKKGEIAVKLGMSAPAVSQRINKIIAKLEEGYFLE